MAEMDSFAGFAPAGLVPRLGAARALAFGALSVLAAAWASTPARATITYIVDPLNPAFTQALGVNGSNTIVGYGNATTFNGFQLVLPPVPANFTRENIPGATGGTQVVGIDAAGDSVGFYINPDGSTHGFFRLSGGSFNTVDQPGSVFNQLLGINQNGTEAAGYSSFTDPAGATGQQAFSVTSSLVYTNINALLPANVNSQATGVNNSGEVVGFYMPTTTTSLGFSDIGGTITPIDPFGSSSAQALGVNDLGEIVGDYTDAMGTMHGFLDNGGIFTAFDPPGSLGTTINGINDLGNFVGFFTNPNDAVVGFFVNPTPEPASLLLLAGGLLGMGMFARRRKAA